MTENGSVAQLCTYARMDTVEVPFTGDVMDAWEDPSSSFLISSECQEAQRVSGRTCMHERASRCAQATQHANGCCLGVGRMRHSNYACMSSQRLCAGHRAPVCHVMAASHMLQVH